MAQIKLGPEDSIVTLPKYKWLGPNRPSLPVRKYKQISEAKMSDGSSRWGFYASKREWFLEWGYLSKAQLDAIEILRDLNQTLKFQNSNEDSTWYDVVFVLFNYEPVRTDILNLNRYKCFVVLREA